MTTYDQPLTAEQRWELFALWREANPSVVSAIEGKALALAFSGHRRISAQYLVEWARYELPGETVGIPYVDASGRAHLYRINNNDVAALARWLVERHPELPIERRRSVLDGVAA